MAKKHIYYDEAENLYVTELMTINEISERLKLSPRVIAYWKKDKDWDEKRKEFVRSKQNFHEDIYEFSREIMQSIREDVKKGEKIDPGRMYYFTRMLPIMLKVKQYEDAAIKTGFSENKKTLTPEEVAYIQEEVLGLKRKNDKH